jgi:hypothetical protein
MALSSTTTRVSYAGDGATSSFAIPFKFNADSHIEVVLRASDGTETTWTDGTQYTLTGAGEANGGTLTVDTSPTDYTPASGETLVIRRKPPLTQGSALPLGGSFPSTTVEAALDLLTMQAQLLDEEIGRGLRFPTTDSASLDPTLPASVTRANKVLAFDASGNPTVSTEDLSDIEGAATSATAAAADAAAAAASETNAAASAAAALASKNAAAAILASGMFSAVQDKSADYAVVEADAGDLLRVATGAADKTITLPLISGLATPEGFKSAAVKWSGTGNVIVAASGAETINGAASYTIITQYETAVFVADAETHTWTAIDQSPPLADGSVTTAKLAANAVTNAKAAQMAANTIKGNNTGATADPSDIAFPIVTGGSWTPADGSGAGLSFTGVSAKYTRTGNMIFAYAQLHYPITADTTAATITGLPVTVPNQDYAQTPSTVYTNTAAATGSKAIAIKNTVTLQLFKPDGTSLTNANLSNAQVNILCIYPAS